MISAASKSFPEPAVSEYVDIVFSQNREELEWLANFLTGDEKIAEACVVDACALAELENPGLQEWPSKWASMSDPLRSANPATTDCSTFLRIHAIWLHPRRTHGLVL